MSGKHILNCFYIVYSTVLVVRAGASYCTMLKDVLVLLWTTMEHPCTLPNPFRPLIDDNEPFTLVTLQPRLGLLTHSVNPPHGKRTASKHINSVKYKILLMVINSIARKNRQLEYDRQL